MPVTEGQASGPYRLGEPVPEELASALRAAEGPAFSQTRLRAAVDAYVAMLRATDVPPERVVVALKAAVGQNLPKSAVGDPDHRLTADVVRWGIDRYYRAD